MSRTAQPQLRPTPTQHMEQQLEQRGFSWVAGCDEVGRGSWAGPLVAAAVILKPQIHLPMLADSKLLTAKQRQALFGKIVEAAIAWGIGMVSASEVDQLGLTQATHIAFDRALVHASHPVSYILVDGQGFHFPATPFSCVVNGDRTVASIAAASILAKVYRDYLMGFMNQLFPGHGFDQHKGYGTAAHHRCLKERGVTRIHRQSFAPIRALAQLVQK